MLGKPPPMVEVTNFANQLVATKIRAILLVDNCSLELHRSLTKICTGTAVSLLTVEYDIRDDLPEETDIFRLAPSSDELIESLLTKRFPHLGQINSHTIATFANGNARVAIALANALNRDETISTLKDLDLFNRLFHQRHNPNGSLKAAAEVCALVYSFNGDDVTSDESELKLLAKLIETTSTSLYREVAELQRRGLVQARNIWRAILPHAIANRLAKSALESIPSQTIVRLFLDSGSERLIKSFTRRLGYLHDSPHAVEIAKNWLKPEGWLGIAECNFSQSGQIIFNNVAPIAPEATLAMLERTAEKHGIARLYHRDYVRLLRHLAYDADLFGRSVRLLCKMALLEKPNINDGDSARATLSSLFHLYLSGTQAPAKIRAKIIADLVNSTIQEERVLGIHLLDATLKTHHFMTHHTSAFGSWPRDFGYRPRLAEDFVDWFSHFLKIVTEVALLNAPIAKLARLALKTHFRGMWSMFGTNINHDFLGDIEDSVVRIHNKQAWNEGWIMLKYTLRYESERIDQGALARLQRLEQNLRPVSLIERARTYVLSDGCLLFDNEGWKAIQEKTRAIGREVAQNNVVFKQLLPDLVANYHERMGAFGEGLAEGCDEKRSVWDALYQQIVKTSSEKRQISVMHGFLSACARVDPRLCEQILDELVEDEYLGLWFTYFQTATKIDQRGIERLHQALDHGLVQIHSFERLAWGRSHESISDNDLAALIQKLLSKPGNVRVAVEILYMRFDSMKGSSLSLSPSLFAMSRQALLQYDYGEKGNANDFPDYRLAKLAYIALQGQTGFRVAKDLCDLLANGFQEYRIYSFNFPKLLNAIAQTQPHVFLDSFVGRDEYVFRRMRFDDLERGDSPINHMPKEIIIDWCEQEPASRYLLITASIQAYSHATEEESLRWQPIVYTILQKSPNLKSILAQLANDIYPMSWSGSRATTLDKRLPLFTELHDYPNMEVQDWARVQQAKLEKAIQDHRQIEEQESQKRFERFE